MRTNKQRIWTKYRGAVGGAARMLEKTARNLLMTVAP